MYTLKITEMFAEAVRKDPCSLRFVSIVVVIIITIIIIIIVVVVIIIIITIIIIIIIIIIISLFKVDIMKLFT